MQHARLFILIISMASLVTNFTIAQTASPPPGVQVERGGIETANQYADAIRPFRSETDPISLGILQSGKDEVVSTMNNETLPFIAIPNFYGFHRKFHVTTGPSFLVIDRNGVVADFIEGYDYERLKQVLTKVSR